MNKNISSICPRLILLIMCLSSCLSVVYAAQMISSEDAAQLVQQQYGGKLIKIVNILKEEDSLCPIYRVRVLRQGTVHTSIVDACKGELIR